MDKWNIDAPLPRHFQGIPIVNNMQSWFISGTENRQEGDVDNLWNLLESALKYSEDVRNAEFEINFIQTFNIAKNQRNVSYKINFGLFWVRPNFYINLDTKMRRYLLDLELIEKQDTVTMPNTEKYLSIGNKVKNIMNQPPINASGLPELSHFANLEDKHSDEVIDSNKVDEPNTNETHEPNYFWINFSPKVRGVNNYNELSGKTIEYSWGRKDKAVVCCVSATSKIKVGDKVLLVDIEPDSGIFAKAEVISEPHLPKSDFYVRHSPEHYVFDMKVTEVFEKVPRTIISELSPFKDTSLKSLLKAVSISELNESQYNSILNYINDDTTYMEENLPVIDLNNPFKLSSLFFENNQHIERQIHTALKQGKNIIFTGPPGTGKSKLASEVAAFYQAEFKMVTASSDWSTYETIGGYHSNKDNQLEFNPGLFLSCVKDSLSGNNLNQWLIIDELNRADIDKAFGSFFSVVTGDSVTLPFMADNSQPIELKPTISTETVAPKEHVYIYPKDWRLIATMNTADKASLFELSYAFMRRFAFINIGVPRHITVQLVEKYLSIWGLPQYSYSDDLVIIWETINQYRKLGPAIIKDLAFCTIDEPNFTDAILLFVMPQLEELLTDDIKKFIDTLKEKVPNRIDAERLHDFAHDFFGDSL